MEPARFEELDKPWRKWASIIIGGGLAFSVLMGFLVIPVVQGYGAGIDPWTAICRAVGIAEGAPSMRQPTSDAQAKPTTNVAWSTDLLRALANTSGPGADLAQSCAACHGARGIAADPQNPSLAGQSAVAIYKQLSDYKTGSRVHEVMTGIAQALDDEQMKSASAHFARLARWAVDPTTSQVRDQDVVRLVERGDPARGLPACNSCHGFSAGGPIETPTLSHQNKEYLARQLRAFKDGSRRNDIYTRMRSVSERLTEREIDKLAEFYATTLNY